MNVHEEVYLTENWQLISCQQKLWLRILHLNLPCLAYGTLIVWPWYIESDLLLCPLHRAFFRNYFLILSLKSILPASMLRVILYLSWNCEWMLLLCCMHSWSKRASLISEEEPSENEKDRRRVRGSSESDQRVRMDAKNGWESRRVGAKYEVGTG